MVGILRIIENTSVYKGEKFWLIYNSGILLSNLHPVYVSAQHIKYLTHTHTNTHSTSHQFYLLITPTKLPNTFIYIL